MLALFCHPSVAQNPSVSSSEPPPVPLFGEESEPYSILGVDGIAERLERLEQENENLHQRLNGLQNHTTVHNHYFKKHLNTPKRAGVFAKVDYLRWAYRQPGLEYGITDVGGVQDRGVVGSVLSIAGEYDNGWRASIGYRFDRSDGDFILDRPELLFSYTEFDTELFDRRIGSLRASFITSDNSENNDSDNDINDITPDDRATSATARMTLNYDVYDLELAQSLELTKSLTLRLSGGARAATVNEHFDVTYTGGDFQVPYRAFRDWDYSGAGMFVGGDMDWSVTQCLSFNVASKSGLVLGRYQSRHFFPDDEPGVPTDVRHSETRVNPFVEVSAGVLYERPIGDSVLTIGAGYEIVNWFNMADNRTFSDSHIEGQNVNTVRDLSLDGMYARIGLNY